MAADEGALARTNRWVQQRFSQYYARARLDLPQRFTKREWAFLFFDKSFMVRHLAFQKRDQLQAYLRDQAPRHAYYSTAFYQDPGAHAMAEKGWKGATLVFDLDADHLRGAAKMGYAEMLAAVKVEFVKLVDRWLVGKLGYDADDVHIVFSGGRGYHAHIEDPRVLELSAYERREVVDLITGKADVGDFLFQQAYKGGRRKDGRGYAAKGSVMPSPERGDWKGDLTRETLAFFRELDAEIGQGHRDDAVRRFSQVAEVPEEEAAGFLDMLMGADSQGARRIDRLLGDHRIELDSGINDRFWRRIHEKLYVQMAGEADEPVTADIKRLIRLPSSIHGKSGLMAKTLTRDELDGFDPLRDALAFGREPVEVEGLADLEFDIGGEHHAVEAGVRARLPEHAAMFVCLRGSAAIP